MNFEDEMVLSLRNSEISNYRYYRYSLNTAYFIPIPTNKT